MTTRRTVVSGLVGWAGTLLIGVNPTTGQTFSCPMGESLQPQGSCELGVCDDPAERDLWLTGATTSPLQIPIKFIVFAEDDGSNRAVTEAQVDVQLVELNDAYKDDHKIEFVAATPLAVFVNSSRFLNLCSNLPPGVACRGPDDASFCSDPTGTEELAMKTLAADNPNAQLNVYVTNVGVAAHAIAWGFFPWCDDPTGVMRGVVIDDNKIGGAFDCGGGSCRTLVHEIGHTLGLWHTFRGATEPAKLIGCCELAACTGDCSDPACNLVGDLCCDTRAMAAAGNCQPPIGRDCDGIFIGQDVTNYMNNAGDGCWNHFTDQQAGTLYDTAQTLRMARPSQNGPVFQP